MKMLRPLSALLVFLAVFSLNSCVSKNENNLMDSPSPYSAIGTDYRESGTFTYTSSEGSLKSAHGCTINYRVFTPENIESLENQTLVVIGHGFFRSQYRQKEMAKHFASWGIWTATMDFCNSRPWNGHHDRNGADMVLLTNELKAEKVIYTGFSAGGLAAFIAASLDERTQAYLGLDMVDNFDKAIKAAPKIKAPVFGLVAESSACNAKNNGLAAYLEFNKQNTPETSQLLRVHGASHCDFEFPYDGKCSYACGKTRKPFERKDVQSSILALSTSMLLKQIKGESVENAESDNWWHSNNQYFNILTESKRISVIQQ